MTIQNWLMISPILFMLLVAIALIPVVTSANRKYAKLAADQRREKHKAAHSNNAESVSSKETPTQAKDELFEDFMAVYREQMENLVSQPSDIESIRAKFVTMKTGRSVFAIVPLTSRLVGNFGMTRDPETGRILYPGASHTSHKKNA